MHPADSESAGAATSASAAPLGFDPNASLTAVPAQPSTPADGEPHARPGSGNSPKDDKFTEALNIGKVPYPNRDDAVLQASAVCVYLSPASGGAYSDATEFIEQHNPGPSDYQAGFFVGAGVRILCPDEVSALPAG